MKGDGWRESKRGRGREVEGRGGEGEEGEGIPVSEVVSAPYTNSVCWNGSVL